MPRLLSPQRQCCGLTRVARAFARSLQPPGPLCAHTPSDTLRAATARGRGCHAAGLGRQYPTRHERMRSSLYCAWDMATCGCGGGPPHEPSQPCPSARRQLFSAFAGSAHRLSLAQAPAATRLLSMACKQSAFKGCEARSKRTVTCDGSSGAARAEMAWAVAKLERLDARRGRTRGRGRGSGDGSGGSAAAAAAAAASVSFSPRNTKSEVVSGV